MIPTPSPITPTDDQAATIAALVAYGNRPDMNVTVDAGPLDETAHGACEDDRRHGPGTVCVPGKWAVYVCPECAKGWMRWFPGELVSLDVLRVPGVATARAA